MDDTRTRSSLVVVQARGVLPARASLLYWAKLSRRPIRQVSENISLGLWLGARNDTRKMHVTLENSTKYKIIVTTGVYSHLATLWGTQGLSEAARQQRKHIPTIFTASFGLLFGPVGTFSIFRSVSMPSITLPNTTCFPSRKSHFAVVMKNWQPFVFGPEFA